MVNHEFESHVVFSFILVFVKDFSIISNWLNWTIENQKFLFVLEKIDKFRHFRVYIFGPIVDFALIKKNITPRMTQIWSLKITLELFFLENGHNG